MSHCIYPGPHSEDFVPEHYLPVALGRFMGLDALYDRVCRRCNQEIGSRVETQFARAGPTGFFRWFIGVKGRDGMPPSPFYHGAGGTQPLYMIGRLPELPFDILFESEPGTENVCPLRQIVFAHPLVGHRAIPLLERFRKRPQDLKDHLFDQGLQDAKPVHVFASADEIPWIESIFNELGYNPPQEWSNPACPPQRIELAVNVQVTEVYFRAVAKIAFHYCLKMYLGLSGLEREFDGIKEFIWNGGKASRFVVQQRDQFITNFKQGYRPTQWMHLLAVQRDGSHIVAFAQFFVGPNSISLPYQVQIGRDPSRLWSRPERRAHQFVILEADPGKTPQGVMQDANPINYMVVPNSV